MQLITKEQASLATVFYALIFSGTTLLSVYKQHNEYLEGSSLFIWILPLIIGLVGLAYLILGKHFRATIFYGAPTVLFAIVVAVVAASTFTRLLSLGLFSILMWVIWYQHIKTQRQTT